MSEGFGPDGVGFEPNTVLWLNPHELLLKCTDWKYLYKSKISV